MAAHEHDRFLQILHSFISPASITVLARAHGWFERQRKIDPVVLVWTLILGFSSGATRSIASLGRAYQRHSGCELSTSGLYQRLDADLAATMTDVLSVCMRPYRRTLGAFEDVLALLVAFELATIVCAPWRGRRSLGQLFEALARDPNETRPRARAPLELCCDTSQAERLIGPGAGSSR